MPDPPASDPPQDPGRTFTQDEVGRLLAADRRERSAGLEEAQERLRALEGERDQALARVQALEPLEARIPELEQQVGQRDSAIEELLIGQAVQAEAIKRGAWAPDDVARLLGRDGLSVKDGKVQGVEKALEEFQKVRPNYFTAPRTPPSDGGPRETSPPRREAGMTDIMHGLRGGSAR